MNYDIPGLPAAQIIQDANHQLTTRAQQLRWDRGKLAANRLAWAASTTYEKGETVENGGNIYIAETDFTSGNTFATELAAGKWTKVLSGGSVADDSVTEAKIESTLREKVNVITPDRATFFIRGKNLFDKTQTFLPNARIIDGDIQENPSFASKVTDFIPVDPSSQYIHESPLNRSYVLYDASKSVVGFGSNWNKDNNPLTTTSTTAYLRFSFGNSDNIDLFQVEKGSVATAYESFRYLLANNYLAQAILKSELPIENVITKAILGDLTTIVRLKLGKNLFDKSKAVVGFLNGDGSVNSGGTNYRASEFIPVEPGATYSFSRNFFLYWFDASKVVISGNQETGSNVHPVAPSGAVYARIACNLSDLEIFQFEKGSVSTAYESYRLLIPEEILAQYAKVSQIPDISSFVKPMPGKNLFDKTQTFLPNARINSGQIQENPAFQSKVSDFIPVEPNTPYVHESVFGRDWMFFDANKTIIGSGGNWYRPNNYITSPAGAKYIRIALDNTTDLNTVQIEKGTAFSFYEPYRLELPNPLNRTQVQNALPGMVNRISLPSKIYVKKGQEDQVYFRPVVWRWRDAFNFRFSGMTNGATRAIVTTNADLFTTMSIYDADFDVVASKGVTLIAADMARNTGNVNVLAIADSYGEPCIWQGYMKSIIPNISLLGTRKSTSGNNLFSEGRSGWTLNNYLTVTHAINNYFSPFLQPSGPHKYYGGTAGWINTLNNTGGANTYGSLLDTGNRIGFSATTGLKTSPAVNDVMWVDANNRYERWDGSAWVAISEATLNFSFNFAKYRSVWGVDLPNVVTFMLGINDFSGMHWRDVASAFTLYKTQLDQAIASVKADNASIKFAVMLPTSAFGDIENQNDVFTPSRNAAMFIQRELLIQYYDNRDAEGIYIIDAASGMDPDFASHVDAQLPFPEYVVEPGFTDEKRKAVRDAIHPDNGYRQIGKRVAAFIQAVR